MRISRKLNLVLPVDTEAHGTVYVHSMPISRDVFEKNYVVISEAFSELVSKGLGYALTAGPRVGALALRAAAEAHGVWDTPDGVANGLMAEIRRLTNVIVAGPDGWRTMPYQDAVRDKWLDPDDAAEVEGAICFFICNSAMHRRDQLESFLDGMSRLWGAQITSSTCSEHALSLPISTATASSGETATISSVPS